VASTEPVDATAVPASPPAVPDSPPDRKPARRFTRRPRLDRERWPRLAGGVASLAVAIALYTRTGINGLLSRDDSIYAYGGQQLAHGVPPYTSIFDPKGPLPTMLAALGAAVARLLGKNDLLVMRLEFLAGSVLTVLMIYLLVLQLWNSVLAGVVAAVVFASFEGFAVGALAGPEAHSPEVLFAVVSMWFAARKQWYWAAFAGSLAFAVKQTVGSFYPLIAIVGAVVWVTARRWRAAGIAIAGALTPLAALIVYFAAVGGLRKFVEAAFVFPVVGLRRAHPQTLRQRVTGVVETVNTHPLSAVLFWIGALLLVAFAVASVVRAGSLWRWALREPLVLVVAATFLCQAGYTLVDFMKFDPYLYPLLPYPAIGFGVATALAVQRLRRPQLVRTGLAVVAAGGIALTAASWTLYGDSAANNDILRHQRATACAIDRIVGPAQTLYAIGTPVPLVLTGRRNPDRFIYLDSGVAQWKIDRTADGFNGWVAQVLGTGAPVIVIDGWDGARALVMQRAIVRAGYSNGYIGRWNVLLTAAALRSARDDGIAVTRLATPWPQTTRHTRFMTQRCGAG
jgi:hypothetical protein